MAFLFTTGLPSVFYFPAHIFQEFNHEFCIQGHSTHAQPIWGRSFYADYGVGRILFRFLAFGAAVLDGFSRRGHIRMLCSGFTPVGMLRPIIFLFFFSPYVNLFLSYVEFGSSDPLLCISYFRYLTGPRGLGSFPADRGTLSGQALCMLEIYTVQGPIH